MTRPVLRRLAACLATGLVVVTLSMLTSSPGASVEDDTPLSVSIATLTPSAIPDSGNVTVTGEVTNKSDSTWTDLKVYMLTSSEPMTTSDELEQAAATDPATEVGGRLFKDGLYDDVGDLPPGASTKYKVSVPRKELQISGASGVYWLGVHVLGESEDGRDSVADGRARTFIPLMARHGPKTAMSLVLPVKETVKRDPDGRLKHLKPWQEQLGADGRLRRLLELSSTAGDVPLTWVVDPAVLDAASSVAEDNPVLDAGPTDTDEVANTTPSPTGSPTASPSDGSTEDSEGAPKELSEQAQMAADWLTRFKRQSARHAVMSTPYGDADVASMLRGDFANIYRKAVDLSATTMENYGTGSVPVVAPPTGFLPNKALPNIDPATPLILSDRAVPDTLSPVVDTVEGNRIVLTDSSAKRGGPGPTPRFRALAERQRILSEAAVHALSGSRRAPLVITTPQQWDPGEGWRQAAFFSGLKVPWLRMANVPTVAAGASGEVYDGKLAYPRHLRRAELPIANLLATQELVETGKVYADLLTRNDTVDESLAKSAMLSSSYSVRDRPHPAVVRARRTSQEIRDRLQQVSIEGPPFVTMSSEEGTFQVTVVNGLEEPVTVGIRAQTGSADLVIHSPGTVSLGGGQRASVRLRATSKDIGVHSVALTPTTPSDEPLGAMTQFSVRSSQVGLVIWVIMGLGATVLFIASGIRIYRRVRSRRTRYAPRLEEQAE